mmetsp:Transcript_15744/g.40012  ORF Transcript_15744/g.40012 Transcript_15744/m.40012 type:complete len:211 (-) Transcript_15744:26-658(-)
MPGHPTHRICTGRCFCSSYNMVKRTALAGSTSYVSPRLTILIGSVRDTINTVSLAPISTSCSFSLSNAILCSRSSSSSTAPSNGLCIPARSRSSSSSWLATRSRPLSSSTVISTPVGITMRLGPSSQTAVPSAFSRTYLYSTSSLVFMVTGSREYQQGKALSWVASWDPLETSQFPRCLLPPQTTTVSPNSTSSQAVRKNTCVLCISPEE